MIYLGVKIETIAKAKSLRNKVFQRVVRDCGQQINKCPYLKNDTKSSFKRMLSKLRNWEKESYKRASKTPPNTLP